MRKGVLTIDNPGASRDGKEIKVKIPIEYHIKLHTLKVLKGQSISDTVERALTRYFDNLATGPEGQRLEALSDVTVRSLV